MHKDIGIESEKNIGVSESGRSLVPYSDSTMLYKTTVVLQGSEIGTLNSSGTIYDDDDKCRNRVLTTQDAALETSKKDDDVAFGSTEFDSSVLSKDDNVNGKTKKLVPPLPKVDKFGRLVREGTSDSSSDDSYYCRRNSRRDRSCSRSWSPLRKNRQRRRSPRTRRGQRSRSRSWSPRDRRSKSRSPRNRRSRSRSPRSRRSRSRSPRNRRNRSRSPRDRRSRSRSPIVRRGKGRILDCFDYLKGRCSRGANCRYMHHDYEESKVQRGEQQSAEVVSSSRASANKEIELLSEAVPDHGKSTSPEKQPSSNSSASIDGNADTKREDSPGKQPSSNFSASIDGNADTKREDSLNGGTPCADVNHNGIGTSASGGSSQCQQSQMLPSQDLGSQSTLKPYQTEVPFHSQVGVFQQQGYPPNQPFMHAAFPTLLPSQKLEVPNLSRGHFLPQPPLQPVSHGSTHVPAMTPLQQLPPNQVPVFANRILPPPVLPNPPSHVNPYSQQQQQPSHSLHNPGANFSFHPPGNISSSYRHPPEPVNTNLPPLFKDFGGYTLPLYLHHPRTSTFQQPVSSNYNFGVSQQASFLPNSARSIGHNFPNSGGDQYNPLLDSVEPYSKIPGKHDLVQNWEANGVSEIIKFSDASKPLDMEVANNKSKDGEGVASAASADDAEVGVVENNSPNSNPMDLEKTSSGDIEIDQVKSPRKKKKSKDSKSMRPFKVAIANFVKDALKPSWRQGNMSKEAFKTIVKKTVDKVSGAMKKHQIPKSQSKIDHYIDSSQRKLTKLVMGYVDKYVKA